jgi:hypothetical protein
MDMRQDEMRTVPVGGYSIYMRDMLRRWTEYDKQLSVLGVVLY